MLKTIKIFYQYNTWATGELLKSLEQLTQEQFTVPGCSGHGSIRDTLAHFYSAQWGWFSWFDKTKTPAESILMRVPGEEISTIEKARARWIAIDKQTHECLEKLTIENLQEIWSATMPNGFTLSLPLWQLLLHVANHGTHTRAQIIAAIRRAGLKPANIEMLNYVLTHKE